MQTVLDFIATLEDISDAALDAIDAAGIADLPVVWNSRLRTSAGRCFWTRIDGIVKADYIELNPKLRQEGPKALRNTFLHEAAHAMEPGAHHGAAWKRAHRLLGGSGARCHRYASMSAKRRTRKTVGRCKRCGVEFQRARALTLGRTYTHPGCGGQVLHLDAAGNALVSFDPRSLRS